MGKMKDRVGPHKPATNYVIDLGSLSPGEMQIEAVRFSVQVDGTAGPPAQLALQEPSKRIQPGFYFVMLRILAGMEDPGQNTDLIHLVEFNVWNEGRNKAVFKTPINMSTLLGIGGPRMDLIWGEHVGFRFFEGADISVEWYVDLANWTEDVKKKFYIILQGFNVRDLLIPEELQTEYTG